MLFFLSSRRRHTRLQGDWSSDVCSSDLVDHDVASGLEALLRDRVVRCVGCGDDDQIDGPGEQLIDAAHEFDSCVARVRRASPMSLDDGGEAEPLYHANDGRVECLARKAETHESDVEHDRDSTSCPERGHLALCVRCST